MIILLSPAKTLDLEELSEAYESSVPVGQDDAEYLAGELRKLTVAKLKSLLGVSDNLAKLNHERFSKWDTQAQKQCIFSYDGPAYKSLDTKSLSHEDFGFAQTHLRIISGLYGYLRPLDAVKPYRLEMGNKMQTTQGKDLYAFWRDKLRTWLKRDLSAMPEAERFIVNCASQEYEKAVDMRELSVPVYHIRFPGPAIFAKAARGAMARYVIQNRVQKPEDLKAFTGTKGEWRFDGAQSSDKTLVFVKSVANPKSKEAAKETPKARTKRKRG